MLDENISPRKYVCLKNDAETKVINAFEFYGLKSAEIKFIKDIILGGGEHTENEKHYLYQVKFFFYGLSRPSKSQVIFKNLMCHFLRSAVF